VFPVDTWSLLIGPRGGFYCYLDFVFGRDEEIDWVWSELVQVLKSKKLFYPYWHSRLHPPPLFINSKFFLIFTIKRSSWKSLDGHVYINDNATHETKKRK